MKIGILTNSYPPNLNGVSVAVANLEKVLVEKGVEVFIVTPRVPGVVYPENVIALRSAPAPSYTSKDLRVPINFGNKVFRIFKEKGVELIHSQDTFMGGIDAVFLAHKLDIPCVHTYHTMVESYDYFKFPGYKQFIRSYSQLVCDSHDAVITLSEKVKLYLQEIEVTAPTYVLPNVYIKLPKPVNESQNKLQDFIQKNKLDTTYNVLTFGRIAKEKNLIAGIETLLPLLKKYPSTRYIIAGDGPELELIKEFVIENNLSSQVIFYGSFNRDELSSLCNLCKFFVITSYSEVLPTTPLEAMSAGLPAICVNDLAYNYLVRDGENGFCRELESLGNCCVNIYEDPKLLEKLKQNSIQTYEKYIKRDFGKEYIDFYSTVIKNYTKTPLIKNLLIKNLNKFGISSIETPRNLK